MAVETKGKNSKELLETKATLVANARSYLSEHEDDWSADREAKYDAMLEDALAIGAVLDRRQKLSNIEGDQRQSPIAGGDPADKPGHGLDKPVDKVSVRNGVGRSYREVPVGARGSADYRSAFSRALSHGASGLAPDQLAALRSDDDPQAGYLVASEQFATGILKDVDDLLFVRQFARIHTVPEATSLGIKKRSAKANTFAWSSELTVSTEDSTLAYSKKTLTPHHMTGLIKLSRDLARRSMGGAESEVRSEMAIDAAETMEDGYLTGNGAQQALGVFTASNDGISTSRDISTDNTTTAITADGLKNAKFALKQQYRNMGPRWLFHRDAIKAIAKLKDGNGRYLWQDSVVLNEPDRLLNYPVDESERVPSTFTTGLYVGLLAVWRYYEIADALDMEVQVLMEKYAETNQIGYIGRLKTDGMPTLEEAFARVTLA